MKKLKYLWFCSFGTKPEKMAFAPICPSTKANRSSGNFSIWYEIKLGQLKFKPLGTKNNWDKLNFDHLVPNGIWSLWYQSKRGQMKSEPFGNKLGEICIIL